MKKECLSNMHVHNLLININDLTSEFTRIQEISSGNNGNYSSKAHNSNFCLWNTSL